MSGPVCLALQQQVCFQSCVNEDCKLNCINEVVEGTNLEKWGEEDQLN